MHAVIEPGVRLDLISVLVANCRVLYASGINCWSPDWTGIDLLVEIKQKMATADLIPSYAVNVANSPDSAPPLVLTPSREICARLTS
jgi:hypothetical protein